MYILKVVFILFGFMKMNFVISFLLITIFIVIPIHLLVIKFKTRYIDKNQ